MSKGSHDKKIFRLLFILNKLDSARHVRTSELAGEFSVSMRTVQRDLELLNMTGFPLVMLERGKYTFAEGFSLKKLTVTEEEASLLSFLYEISKDLGKNFEDSFRGILGKVLVQDVESSFYAKIPQGAKPASKIPFIKELDQAIEEYQKIEILYQAGDKEKAFKIHPLKIAFFDGFWYLVARIDSKEWIVKFRPEKIKKIKISEETFEPAENLKVILDQSVNAWFSEKRDKKVVLKVDKDAARYFKQRKYFPLQRIRKENRNGSLIIESKVCDHMEVIPNILRWIPSVKVVSPESLKKRIRENLEQYLMGEKG